MQVPVPAPTLASCWAWLPKDLVLNEARSAPFVTRIRGN